MWAEMSHFRIFSRPVPNFLHATPHPSRLRRAIFPPGEGFASAAFDKINYDLPFYSFTNSQNISIWSATVCRALRQKFLSVRSMSATFATSSAVAMGVV